MMGPVRTKCGICGAPIGEIDYRWLNEFRAVYTNGHEWSFPRLSGVGFRFPHRMNTTEVLAPIDPHQRFDDSGYDLSGSTMAIMDMNPMYESDNLAPPLGDPNMLAQNAPWGYLFHDVCWKLLTEACYPAEIDVRVLNDFCRSFPSGFQMINWGHDYGGIYETPSEIPPGGIHYLGQLKEENKYPSTEIYHANPLCIPHLDTLLKETAEKHETTGISASSCCSLNTSNPPVDTRKDCFERFPPELREMVLLYLPARDVLNLFLSSRAFASSPVSQAFWASRFQQNFEFSSIFESKGSAATRDWRSLFHGLRKCSKTLHFQNRKRIWDILQPLVDAMISFSNATLSGISHPTFFEPDIGDDGLQWKSARCNIVEPKIRFYSGSRILFTRSANIPSRIVAIHVSMIRFGGAEFITGLRFVDALGASADIGYILPGKELYLNIQDRDTETPNCLRGFHLAVEQNGIRALAAVMDSGEMSAWAGSPQNSPRMRLLSCSGEIGKVKGDFDGLKLVSLSIPENEQYRDITPSISLRDSRPWFPEIPHESLCLNDQDFQVMDDMKEPYWPLYWMHFGGFQGAYLSNVIALSAWVSHDECTRIEIEYDREVQGTKVHTLSACLPLSEEPGGALSPTINSKHNKVTFGIDGPNGEFVSSVCVGKISPSRTYLSFLEVSTNRRRSATFLRGRAGTVISHSVTTECEKSTAITGFYAKTSSIFANLGVISEPVALPSHQPA